MEPPHLLIIDDDARLRALLRDYLHDQGFRVTMAESAETARATLQGLRFDAIILDVMMPQESGITFAKTLRINDDTPILMLSAMSQPEDRINGFRSGIDDYLCKPFEPRELVMRVQAILKRTASTQQQPAHDDPPTLIYFGEYRFNTSNGELLKNQEKIHLTESETALLSVLAHHVGTPVGRRVLQRSMGLHKSGRSIDVQIARLRRKIEENTKTPHYICTRRSQGYFLNGFCDHP